MQHQSVMDLAWKNGVCQEGQLLMSLFSIKPHFLLNTRNRPMNFAMLPKYESAKLCQCTVYWQYLLMKAITLVFCTECLET